jgi:hypothetical protein
MERACCLPDGMTESDSAATEREIAVAAAGRLEPAGDPARLTGGHVVMPAGGSVVKFAIMIVACGLIAAACGGAGGPSVAQQPRPLPERGEVRSEPIDEDHVRIWPASGAVQEGVAYQMTAYTHCGLDHALDFDGSFWEVEAGPDDPRDVLDNPEDEGVITLQSQDVAVYISSGGGDFRLRRVEGPREILLCE